MKQKICFSWNRDVIKNTIHSESSKLNQVIEKNMNEREEIINANKQGISIVQVLEDAKRKEIDNKSQKDREKIQDLNNRLKEAMNSNDKELIRQLLHEMKQV